MVRFTLIAVVGVMGLFARSAVWACAQNGRRMRRHRSKGSRRGQRKHRQESPLQVPGEWSRAMARLTCVHTRPWAAKLEPAELAGLAAGSKPAVLTLDQAYLLTMIREKSANLLGRGPDGSLRSDGFGRRGQTRRRPRFRSVSSGFFRGRIS